MKVLFFDMEFANGQVPGSIYSVGYLMTNGHFHILKKPQDLLINPECKWNAYVAAEILAYSRKEVESSHTFPQVYEQLKTLFLSADLVVGYASNNDTGALYKACKRYELEPISFPVLDIANLAKRQPDYPLSHGLDGMYEAWCGEKLENQHRSDIDAMATMKLFQAICKKKKWNVKKVMKLYPDLITNSLTLPKEKKKDNKKRRYYHNQPKKKEQELKGDNV